MSFKKHHYYDMIFSIFLNVFLVISGYAGEISDPITSGGNIGEYISSIPDLNVGFTTPTQGVMVSRVNDRVYVFDARTSGSTAIYTKTPPNPPPSGQNWGWGAGVTGIKDFQADGHGDFAVSQASETVNGIPTVGRVYVYGGKQGFLLHTLNTAFNQAAGNNLFGRAIDGIDDINGDGRGDLIVGAPGESYGRVYLWSFANGPQQIASIAAPQPVQNGLAYFGWRVCEAGSVSDPCVLVWTRAQNGVSQWVYVFNKKVTGNWGVNFIIKSNEHGSGVTYGPIASLGDTNGDGYKEIVIGDPYFFVQGLGSTGRAYIFNGATGALMWTLASPYQQTGAHFGAYVEGLADADGDGNGDVLVGAHYEDVGGNADSGRVYLINGATGGIIRIFDSPYAWPSTLFGIGVHSIKDVDADGNSDIMIGHGSVNIPGNADRVYTFSGATGQPLE